MGYYGYYTLWLTKFAYKLIGFFKKNLFAVATVSRDLGLEAFGRWCKLMFTFIPNVVEGGVL